MCSPAAPALAAGVTAPTAPAGSMLAARQKATAQHKTVPVDSLTSQTSETVANPDGSFTSTTHLKPVRVRKGGSWTPVDPTLRKNADGSWSPAASPHGVALSGGGAGPVVRLAHEDGNKLALTMPFPLPAPEVSGDTALYRSVLPGVDLSVSVTGQGGFSDILVVHDAAAAADPRLRELRLATSAEGLKLNATDSGGMTATAADGSLAYISPRPVMWDSSTPAADSPSAPAAKSFSKAAGATSTDRLAAPQEHPGPPPASSVEGPGSAALVDEVPMSTTSDSLTLRPDVSALSGPDVVYPVYIDPYTNPVSSKSGHYDEVYSSGSCSGSPQYDKPQSSGEGVGYQRWGGACGTGLERSYYAINTSGLSPRMVVSKALITIPTTYAASWNCSKNQPITLRTTGMIYSTTSWNNQPSVDGGYAAASTSVPSGANSSSSCSNSTATFTVTAQAQKIALNGTDTWTVGLFGDESISSGNDNYLRLSTVMTLVTTFDIAPEVPADLHTTPSAVGASGPCTITGLGWVGATSYSDAGSNLQLHSTVRTNVSGELAGAVYEFWDRTTLTNGNPTTIATPSSPYLASGSDAAVPVGIALKDGHEYGWDAYAKDNASAQLTSPVSEHCWFRTDFSPPETPGITTNPSFPPVGGGAGNLVVYAGPGRTTSFDVAASDSAPAATCTPGPCLSSGVDHFVWRLDSRPTAQAGTSAPVGATDGAGRATAKVTVPVTAWGVHTLYVAAADKAGNLSQAPVSYTYAVPWNPDTKITPGDISGDGIPDLLATTRTGDLNLIPGNTDAAQPVQPVQTAPHTDPAPPATGPVTVASAAHSPDGTGWDNYLIAHRGNLHGSDVDDLLAYNKQSHQLYIVKNDLDPAADNAFPRVPYSTYAGFTGRRFDVVPKDPCESAARVADDTRCRTAGYDASGWSVDQLVTPGNLYGNTTDYPAVVTVENKKLWIYQTDGGGHFKHPLLLGDGDWSGLTLMGPGTVGGTLTTDGSGKGTVTGGAPALWARDDVSGTVYSFPVTVDAGTLVPALLHAPVRTALPSAVPVSGGGKQCLDVDHQGTANGTKVQVYACNGTVAQGWTLMSDGSIRALGRCLDVNGNGVSDGTIVQLWSCNGTGAQKWTLGASGSLVNPSSGKCLDDPNASTTPGTQMVIFTCNGTVAQNWTTGATAGWQTSPAVPLAPVLPKSAYPAVMSPGDLNSAAGGPDANPELYAVDAGGQLLEFPGTAPQAGLAGLDAPASLGAVGSSATHAWRLDEGAGTSVADGPGTLDATLGGAYTWTTDATRGRVLNLAGTTGYAAGTGPAVDTSGSYSVSAWVKLGSLTGNSTFVSQTDAADKYNGMQLYYSSGKKVWAFGMHHDPAVSTTTFSAVYGESAQVGRWTHLVGVYEADTAQLSLYVDGKLSATGPFTSPGWNAAGPVQIGRRIASGAYGEYANGAVSDVRIYPTALPAANAAATGDLPGITQLD
ncbi:LamG-like jellyroll fold domain-containing protein [Streptomyces sp. NPDC060028]|uniref:LamG-like jellyroll fold domain-containing protein n=1 Tax=Streptomyces sp. NPDC060028 TaxID=3347041 RepID=UPI00369B8F43